MSADSADPSADSPVSERDWEIDISSRCVIKDSLKNSIHFWKTVLKVNNFLLNIIKDGYLLPFDQPPPPFQAKNNSSSFKHRDFVLQAINKLLHAKLKPTDCRRQGKITFGS